MTQSTYFVHDACHYQVTIRENIQIARDTYRLRFECPRMARRILPGQFLMLRLYSCDDPLLGRPLALYDTFADEAGCPCGIDVVYLVLGKLTTRLADSPPGTALEVWGPLGNGFPPQATEHLVMVAGGIGQTPFLALAREHLARGYYGDPMRKVSPVSRVTFCYGVRNQAYLAGLDDFAALGIEVLTSTDDGSAGHHGLVTDLLSRVLDESPRRRVVCCGPEPMMHRVAEITTARNVPCDVSLETPMACGLGICFSCVARVRTASRGWDYRRTCVEGPVFDAESIEW